MPRLLPAGALALALLPGPIPPTAFTPGHAFVVLQTPRQILEIDGAGLPVRTLGPFSGGAELIDLAFGPDGRLFVTQSEPGGVLELDASGTVVGVVGSSATIPGTRGLCVGPDGHLLVASATAHIVAEFDSDGALVRTIGGGSGLSDPQDVAVGADGHLFVSSGGSHTVFEFTPCGSFVREIGGDAGLVGPTRLSFGPGGVLWVVSPGAARVVGFDAGGNAVSQLVPASGPPLGIAFAANGSLLVTCGSSETVEVFLPDGTSLGAASSLGAGPFTPGAVALAPFRFQAKVKGTNARAGAPDQKVSETVTISYLPGTRELSLRFASHPDTPGSLAALVEAKALVLQGFEIGESLGAPKRVFYGTQIPWPARRLALSAVVATVKGKGTGGSFAPTKVAGSIHHATGTSVLEATFSTTKLLK